MIIKGAILSLSGLVTLQRFVQGRSLSDIERMLGYTRGYFSEGAIAAVATTLPEIDGFFPIGIASSADGKGGSSEAINKASKDSEYEVRLKLMKESARNTWSLQGISRLVSFMPKSQMNTHLNSGQFTQGGRMIPQWHILRDKAIPFRVTAVVEGYPNALFEPDEGYTNLF
jgi:hypothetical protein